MRIASRLNERPRAGFVGSIIAMVVLFTVACDGTVGQVEAVRLFAQNAASAEPVFTAIAADFYASCVRQYNWEIGSGEIDKRTSLAAYCGKQTTPELYAACEQQYNQGIASGRLEKRISLVIYCGGASTDDAAHLWQKTNLVLLSYVRGLGALAGDQSNDYGIPKLKDEVIQAADKTKHPIDKDTANIVSQFAQWVVSSHFAQRRKQELAKVTADADEHVQKLTLGLERIATKRYADQLWAEQQGLDAFYSAYLPGPPVCERPPCAPPVPLSQPLLVVDVLSYRQQWMRDRQTLAGRYAAIDAYVDALDKIAKGHSGLVTVLNGSKPAASVVREHLLADFARDVALLSRTYSMAGGAK